MINTGDSQELLDLVAFKRGRAQCLRIQIFFLSLCAGRCLSVPLCVCMCVFLCTTHACILLGARAFVYTCIIAHSIHGIFWYLSFLVL